MFGLDLDAGYAAPSISAWWFPSTAPSVQRDPSKSRCHLPDRWKDWLCSIAAVVVRQEHAAPSCERDRVRKCPSGASLPPLSQEGWEAFAASRLQLVIEMGQLSAGVLEKNLAVDGQRCGE